MSTASVTGTHLTFGGIKYFRGNATAVALGSYGRKKTPPFKTTFLEVDANLDLSKMIVAPAVVVDLDVTSSKKGDVEINLNVVGFPVKGGIDSTFNALASHELKLVQFCLKLNEVKAAINDSSEALEDLQSSRAKARVVHQIWIVMHASEATKFAAAASIHASVTENGFELTAKAGGSGEKSTSVTLSSGSTYAYLFLKPKLVGDRVESLATDQWGIG
jgi:hypothetical protein